MVKVYEVMVIEARNLEMLYAQAILFSCNPVNRVLDSLWVLGNLEKRTFHSIGHTVHFNSGFVCQSP